MQQTIMPKQIDVAVSHEKKINKLPNYPKVKLCYPKGKRYSSEIIEIKNDFLWSSITNPPK